MIGRLNHIAIAVPNLEDASQVYKETLGAIVSEPVPMPDHGVTTVFVELPNTKIELIEPLGEESPISAFIKKHPKGGMHHVCFEVNDIFQARDQMIALGATIVGAKEPAIGAHNKPVIFMHPKDFLGTLIELEQKD
ncbi:MAG TPA: methylmalonyl-CoA epimerase [Gammaproteobacteria bacterium]|jgi:methylmalonyl-CoA/ethylmalonyl-CoA epimerase|nr:methylmalonyl-CoA epimerase [Gammaproteobacteria bacterium]HIK77374.1 methylmalonyl-CoA epimerase [Gammaproteobacteria bacterium]